MPQKWLDSVASLLDVGPDIVWMSVQTKESGSDQCVYFATCFQRKAHKQMTVLNAFMCAFISQENCVPDDTRRGSSPQTMLKAQEQRILFNGSIYILLQKKHWEYFTGIPGKEVGSSCTLSQCSLIWFASERSQSQESHLQMLGQFMNC